MEKSRTCVYRWLPIHLSISTAIWEGTFRSAERPILGQSPLARIPGLRRLAVISLNAFEPEKLGREGTVAYLDGSKDDTELIDFTVPLLPYPFTKPLYSVSSC